MRVVDGVPDARIKLDKLFEDYLADDGNTTLVTLCVCLLTVLYLRQKRRRHHQHVTLLNIAHLCMK